MSEEILETPQQEPPPLPAVRMVVEDYNPEDAQHYAQWLASGSPALPWQTTWYEDLQPDGETYVRRPQPQPPEQAPVTDVERMATLFGQAQAGAPAYLNQLKGAVWVALVAAGMSEADATAAGVALVLRHAAPLAAFEAAGGHPVAAAALYQAISSAESVAALPWLTAPILAIFQAALAPA